MSLYKSRAARRTALETLDRVLELGSQVLRCVRGCPPSPPHAWRSVSAVGLQAFRWFLRSEFSEENLEFWLACEEYKNSSGPKLAGKAQSIYNQFINPEAPREVNLDSETREGLTGLMQEPTADTFDEAQHRIFSLMAKDSFPRFQRSLRVL